MTPDAEIKWLLVVVINQSDCQGVIGPFIESANAEAFAIQACQELGIGWDGEHMCSIDYVFQKPGERTLPNVVIETHEIDPPFVGVIWAHLKKIALDGDA